MTKLDYLLRGALYFGIATLPILKTDLGAHVNIADIVIDVALAGLIAIRAYSDKATQDRADTKVQEDADAATVNAVKVQ